MDKFVTVNEEVVRENVMNWSDNAIKASIVDRSRYAFLSMDIITSEMNKDIVKVLEMILIEREKERKKKEVHHTRIGRFLLTVKHDRFIIDGGKDMDVTDLQTAKKQLQKVIDEINEFIQ